MSGPGSEQSVSGAQARSSVRRSQSASGLSGTGRVRNRERAQIESPTIRKLSRGLCGKRRTALKEFWTNVEESRTPLVERLGRRRRSYLVTFLWRGRPGTRSVALRSFVAGWSPNAELVRLPRSDVWYRSYWVPNDLRDTYRFAINEPPTVFPASVVDYLARMRRWKIDPLNPREVHEPADADFPGDRGESAVSPASLVELPRASRRRELVPHPNIQKGTLRLYRLRSRILRDHRRIWVYTPAGAEGRARDRHLAFFFDGFTYTHLIPVPTILDNLLRARRIYPTIAVFVDQRNSLKDRMRDLCGRSSRFGRFLNEELVPWVERTCGIKVPPSRTLLAGLSCGGLSALHWALQFPNRFRLVLSQSGSFQMTEKRNPEPGAIIRDVMGLPRRPLRIYMEAGIYEGNYLSPEGTGATLLSSNRHLRDVLCLKGYQLTYKEFSGGHENQCWQQSVVDGLVTLLGPRRRQPRYG